MPAGGSPLPSEGPVEPPVEPTNRPAAGSPGTYHPRMPEIEFAFLADSADARPGEKFNVLGGGVMRLGAQAFPFRHPHLALVVALLVATTELEKEHDVRFALLAPDGSEIAVAVGGDQA